MAKPNPGFFSGPYAMIVEILRKLLSYLKKKLKSTYPFFRLCWFFSIFLTSSLFKICKRKSWLSLKVTAAGKWFVMWPFCLYLVRMNNASSNASSWLSHCRYKFKAILFFFPPFSVVWPTQIFGIFKKKSNDVVKPFSTWNNFFNLKNGHSNSIEKNSNIFYSILCILLIQICEC